MKKLFIETKLIEEALQKAGKLADAVNVLGADLQKEGSILTHRILNDFFEEGYKSLESLFFNEALKLLKVKPEKVNSALRSGIWSGAEEVAKKFSAHQESIHKAWQNSGINFSDLEIKAGKASVPDSLKAEFEERFSYSVSPDDQELYNRISSTLDFLSIENANLQVAAGISLFECIDILSKQTSTTSADHPYKSQILRDDLPIIKNELGKLTCNPAWFDSRVNTSTVSTDKTTKNEEN